MARVTERAAAPADSGTTDGTGPGDATGRAPAAAASASAPTSTAANAVRVRLAPASRRGTEPTRTVAVLAQRQARLDRAVVEAAIHDLGNGRHVLEADGRTPVVIGPARVAADGIATREVLVDGFRFEVETEPERRASLRERATRGHAAAGGGGPLEVRAVIPGKVLSVSVTAGDRVTAGQTLLVIEAMKMQNELRAPRDGTIDQVGVAEGVKIEIGDVLVVIGQEGAG
jgi:glutaconyl-CoA decarboxylase